MIYFYDESGRKFSNVLMNLTGLKLSIPAPRYEITTAEIEGGGEIVLDRRLLPRPLTAVFFQEVNDYLESISLRNTMYSLLSGGKELYVAESKDPGRRWKIYTQDWEFGRANQRVLQATIPLVAPTGLAESVNLVSREFDTPSFLFNNQGNELIDMRTQNETEITLTGASTVLTITNETTGDVWKYNGTTLADDVILLKGVQSFKNGSSIFPDTNRKLLTFAPGVNKLTISGAESVNLTIRTRFYFL